MIGQTISHYPALWDSASKRDSGPAVRDPALCVLLLWREKRNKIVEKLGEGGMSPARTTEKELSIARSGGQNRHECCLRVVAISRISRYLDSALLAGFQKAEPPHFGGRHEL